MLLLIMLGLLQVGGMTGLSEDGSGDSGDLEPFSVSIFEPVESAITSVSLTSMLNSGLLQPISSTPSPLPSTTGAVSSAVISSTTFHQSSSSVALSIPPATSFALSTSRFVQSSLEPSPSPLVPSATQEVRITSTVSPQSPSSVLSTSLASGSAVPTSSFDLSRSEPTSFPITSHSSSVLDNQMEVTSSLIPTPSLGLDPATSTTSTINTENSGGRQTVVLAGGAVGGGVVLVIVAVVLVLCVLVCVRRKKSVPRVLHTFGAHKGFYQVNAGCGIGTEQEPSAPTEFSRDKVFDYGLSGNTFGFSQSDYESKNTDTTEGGEGEAPALIIINAVDRTIPIRSNSLRIKNNVAVGDEKLSSLFDAKLPNKKGKSSGAVDSDSNDLQLHEITEQRVNSEDLNSSTKKEHNSSKHVVSESSADQKTSDGYGYLFKEPTDGLHGKTPPPFELRKQNDKLSDIPKDPTKTVAETSMNSPRSQTVEAIDASHYDVPQKLMQERASSKEMKRDNPTDVTDLAAFIHDDSKPGSGSRPTPCPRKLKTGSENVEGIYNTPGALLAHQGSDPTTSEVEEIKDGLQKPVITPRNAGAGKDQAVLELGPLPYSTNQVADGKTTGDLLTLGKEKVLGSSSGKPEGGESKTVESVSVGTESGVFTTSEPRMKPKPPPRRTPVSK